MLSKNIIQLSITKFLEMYTLTPQGIRSLLKHRDKSYISRSFHKTLSETQENELGGLQVSLVWAYSPTPTPLTAATRNSYGLPFVSPLIVTLLSVTISPGIALYTASFVSTSVFRTSMTSSTGEQIMLLFNGFLWVSFVWFRVCCCRMSMLIGKLH